MDKGEIERAVAHRQKILRVLRQRLQQRELQEAQQGINAPPEVISDIHELTERIQRHEANLARLQTEAAVDKEPLAEVEYRMLLAEAWSTETGRPTVAGAARLEYNRLRLGVAPDRAQEIEREVRKDIAEEIFYYLDAPRVYRLINLDFVPQKYYDGEYGELGEALTTARLIGRSVRLDPKAAVQRFATLYRRLVELETLSNFADILAFMNNATWPDGIDLDSFEIFLNELKSALAARKLADLTDSV